MDEKAKTVALTETGVLTVEKLLGVKNLYEPANIDLVHHVQQGLRAHTLYKRDVDYVVKEGEVIIVDEFTGRLMAGRRWSDGLHQAVEAKEKVKIQQENQTLASITIQNYFRMYAKLVGHDRHRGYRGGGVRQDLQPGRGGHPHQPAARPGEPQRRGVQEPAGKAERGGGRDHGTVQDSAARSWWARPPSRSPRR